MTSRTLALALLTAAVTFPGAAAHAESGLTREQVKAELAQAQRTGDLLDYETGLKLNQLFPGAYAAKAADQGVLAAVDTLPATSAGPAAVTKDKATAQPAVRGGLSSATPWDYDAISQRNAEALARGGRSF